MESKERRFEGWKYFSVYLFVPLTLAAIETGGWWAWTLPVIAFGALPVLELLLPAEDAGRWDAGSGSSAVHNWVLYLAAPLQYWIMLAFLHRVSTNPPQTWELAGLIWTVGIWCGVFGINVSHELGHRYTMRDQLLAKLLLLTTLYTHIVVHHNRGHHAFFGTPKDPNTARRGEPLFFFWARSILGSYLSAWRIENRRLRTIGRSPWTLGNEILRWQLAQLACLAAVAYFFGGLGLLAFAGASASGVVMLETINYIEHYGLFRRRLPDGRYERMADGHAWNSNHPLGRLFLLEVTRHPDHHLRSGKPYHQLRHLEKSPQMPTGYPGMMVLAALPPLFFKLIHPRLDQIADPAAHY